MNYFWHFIAFSTENLITVTLPAMSEDMTCFNLNKVKVFYLKKLDGLVDVLN